MNLEFDSINTLALFAGAYPLHEVSQGRLFRREVGDERCLYIGLLELPRNCPDEQLVTARVNSQLWLDLEHPIDPYSRNPNFYRGDKNGVGGLGEHSASDVITALKFGSYDLPDMAEFFLRKSALPHQDPSLSWVIATGASDQSLKVMPRDGLYGFKAGVDVQLVDPTAHHGEAFAGMLRLPVWGPNGDFGLSHSLSCKTYPHWIAQNRAQNIKSDPLFAAYMAKRKTAGAPEVDYYSKAEHAEQQMLSSKLIRELIDERDNTPEKSTTHGMIKRPLPRTR